MAAVLNILDLIAGDHPTDYRQLPVVIRGNQSPVAIVQFQCWIDHCIWNSVLTEFRANRTQNHPLWLSSLYDEPANHHVIARLNKAAGTEIAQIGGCGIYQVVTDDIEVDPFWRCRRDIGRLPAAGKRVLHERMQLRTDLA